MKDIGFKDHIELFYRLNQEYHSLHESTLLAKQVIEKQKKAHCAGQQK